MMHAQCCTPSAAEPKLDVWTNEMTRNQMCRLCVHAAKLRALICRCVCDSSVMFGHPLTQERKRSEELLTNTFHEKINKSKVDQSTLTHTPLVDESNHKEGHEQLHGPEHPLVSLQASFHSTAQFCKCKSSNSSQSIKSFLSPTQTVQHHSQHRVAVIDQHQPFAATGLIYNDIFPTVNHP